MNITTLLKKTNRLLIKKANELLKPLDVNHAYTYFLLELYKKDGQKQADMYSTIGIEQPTAVRTLDRMERDGFIKRVACVQDRRATIINLTAKGRSYENSIMACAKELNALALKGFDKSDKEVLQAMMQKIIINLS